MPTAHTSVPNPGLNQSPEGQSLRAPVSASAGSTKTRSLSDPLRDSLGATVTGSVHCDHGTGLLLVPTRYTTSTQNAVCNAKSEPLVAFPPIFHSMQLPADPDPEETSCSLVQPPASTISAQRHIRTNEKKHRRSHMCWTKRTQNPRVA